MTLDQVFHSLPLLADLRHVGGWQLCSFKHVDTIASGVVRLVVCRTHRPQNGGIPMIHDGVRDRPDDMQ